jgi:protein TonB
MTLSAEDLADLRRWAISGGLVVLAYGAIAAAMVTWHEPIEPDDLAGAIVIEFAPVLAAPVKQTELPPGPEMTASDASPDKPVESVEEKIEEKVKQKVEAKLEQKVEEKVESKPVEEPPPEVKPAPNPEIAIQPPPPQEVKQETPKRQEPRPPAPATSALQSIPEQTAAIPVAPTQGKPKPSTSNAVPTWTKQVAMLLERTIRYPEAAERRGQTGVVQVFFSLDRRGHLVDSPRVVRSSGVPVLDEEAVAVLRRAQPLPPPPSEFPGDPVTLIVPIRFLPLGASPVVKR